VERIAVITDIEAREPLSEPSQGERELRRIEDLPKEVGAMLVTVGVLGVVMPGMAGGPALLAGGLVLWPRTFGRLETWFARRYPSLHERGMQQVGRYLNDLERRFPATERDRKEQS
jgi:hypothetical protein